jgi:hypothetical protein
LAVCSRLTAFALAAIALAGVAAACATPAPTPSPTPETTEAILPAATMSPFDVPYPDEGWAVASAVDGTGDVERVIAYGSVTAGALLDFASTCEQPARISVVASDGSAASDGVTLFRFEVPCSPGDIRRVSAPSTSATMPINLDVTVDPGVPFWVKLGVPADHLLR